MKLFKKTVAIVLALAMLISFAASCKTPDTNDTDGSENETLEELPPENKTMFNIIFALASIPPVLAALDSIESGYPTYAIIERGKTYSGIESIENFYNVGFDPANNLSQGFTKAEFEAMVNKVKELNETHENAYFNFYVQDGTALKGAAIAANAGLGLDQFHVYMCEDGTGAYHALYEKYIAGKTVNETVDEAYTSYVEEFEKAKSDFNAVMAKTDNKNADAVLGYNIGKAFALASLDNFTYYLQDEDGVIQVLEKTGRFDTKLLSVFGVEGREDDVEVSLNLKYQKISEGIAKLTEDQRTDYLTLMYGQYYAETFETLTRTERAGEKAPSKKLVFIGARHSDYPKLVSNEAYGIGGLKEGEKVPETYEELDMLYKTPFLFETPLDYYIFLDELENEDNYTEDIPEEVKDKVKAECFNIYVNYMFTLKFIYLIYGEEYDIIMKGHPREAIGCYEEWGNRYKVKYDGDKEYVYDKLLDSVLLAFHENDIIGEYIGMVPYGTAAENLAYLGADITIGGLPSSTYSGFDPDVDVLFIMAETDEDIAGSGKDEAVSQVKARYEAGTLHYTDKNGREQKTVFYNTGNVYKSLVPIIKAYAGKDWADACTALFKAWLGRVHPGATDIDTQGFPKK